MFQLSFANNTSDYQKPVNGKYRGPFGATQMWNDIVKAFRNGMPVQRHWKSFKRYDNCFVASDAVNWLHDYLATSPDFGSYISRTQVELLLTKLYDAKIFEEVDKSRVGFQPGNKLYRFCDSEFLPDVTCFLKTSSSQQQQASSLNFLKSYFKPSFAKNFRINQKKVEESFFTDGTLDSKHSSSTSTKSPLNEVLSENKRTNFSLPTSSTIDCPPITPRRSQGHVFTNEKAILQDSFLSSLSSAVEHRDFKRLVQKIRCNTDHLLHNFSLVNKNGMPTNIDKKDQLPLWLVTALKSLASGSLNDQLVRETIGVICDYLTMYKNNPLVTKDLYNVIVFTHKHLLGKSSSSELSKGKSTRNLSSQSFKDLIRKDDRMTRSMYLSTSDDKSRAVLSAMDSFDFIDSTPRLNKSSFSRKTDLTGIENVVGESTKCLGLMQISNSSKPLNFFGVKQLKKTKREKKLKSYNSLLDNCGSGYDDDYEERLNTLGDNHHHLPSKHCSNYDLSGTTPRHCEFQLDPSVSSAIRSEENLAFMHQGDTLPSVLPRYSKEASRLIEVLQHIMLLVVPAHRRIIMIVIRLLAKISVLHVPNFDQLLNTFVSFILCSSASKEELSAAKNICHFMMETYAEIFKTPQAVVDAIQEFRRGRLPDQKENQTPTSNLATSYCKESKTFPLKSILKKPSIRFEAVRF